MLRIAYYISDYGFGHATRSSAIIQGLIETLPRVEIVVCNSFAMPFLEQYFLDERVKFRHVSTDLGYFLKEDSLEPDVDRLNREFDSYIEKWDKKVGEEVRFIQNEKVDMIISDIVPTAFEAGKLAGVHSIGISNFTWYTAYEGLISEEKLAPLKKAYDEMDTFLALAGENEPLWGGEKYCFDFFSREINDQEVKRIREMLNPDGEKTLIYFGLGMKITHDDLDQFAFWDDREVLFIVSSNTHIEKENVYRIPPDYLDTHHFIAAADLAISKAGWGSVSEAVIGNTPLLIIDRQSMKEDRNTISFLKERNLCKTISWEELKGLRVEEMFINEIKHQLCGVQKNQLNEIIDKINELVQLHTIANIRRQP
ncbi:hypothetical protein ACQKFO_15060 [Rossellomorea sp. NPDC071047]|uniref:hypothetical protein n=1 Tax=Rossellomorea sp. NPDC071047 TaxID=3390675 RepID=UPI003CFD20B7